MKREPFKHPITQVLGPLILDMCRYPDDCKIHEVTDSAQNLLIRVEPNRADFRIIVGAGGRQIRALQYFARRTGYIKGLKADVKLDETLVGELEPRRGFQQNPEYDVEALMDRIRTAAEMLLAREVRLSYTKVAADEVRVDIDVNPEEPEETASVIALSDIFYPTTYGHGLICKIKSPKRLNLTT